MAHSIELSPIQELTDMDLSYLINQLSSASGEITEKTIEELLKDAEKILLSSSHDLQSDNNEQENITIVSEKNTEPTWKRSSGNVFMNAIASLSEVTNRIQSELVHKDDNLEQGCEHILPVSSASDDNINPAINTPKNITNNRSKNNVKTSISVKPNPINIIRTHSQPISKCNSSIGTSFNQKITSASSSAVRNSSTVYGNPNINSDIRPKKVFQRTIVRKPAVRLLGASSQKVTQRPQTSGRNKTTIDCRAASVSVPKKTVYRGEDSSSQSEPKRIESKAKVNSFRPRPTESSDSYSQNGGVLRQLQDENVRLHLQVKQLQARLRTTPNRGGSYEKINITAKNEESCIAAEENELAPKLDEFQLQLSEIKAKYEAQLLALTKKCEQLEGERKAMEISRSGILKSVENLPKFDMACQTEKEKRDACCQSSRSDNFEQPHLATNNKISTEEIQKNSSERQCVITEESNRKVSPKKLTETQNKSNSLTCLPNINFEFNDIDVDNQFVPWRENVNENLPEKQTKASMFTKNRKHCKDEKPKVMNGDQHLLTTIKGLQIELQAKEREIRKLKNEVASGKTRQLEKMKGGVRRTAGSQTIGLFSSNPVPYNPKIFQDTTKLSRDNENLKEALKSLEIEIADVKEKRVQDLKLLQEKHEEEVSALLEQKLFLANKLDALLARTFR